MGPLTTMSAGRSAVRAALLMTGAGDLGEPLVGRQHLRRVDLEAEIGAAKQAGGPGPGTGPAGRGEHDDVVPQRPVRLDAPARQFLREPGEMLQPGEFFVADFPDGADRGRRTKQMLLLAG